MLDIPSIDLLNSPDETIQKEAKKRLSIIVYTRNLTQLAREYKLAVQTISQNMELLDFEPYQKEALRTKLKKHSQEKISEIDNLNLPFSEKLYAVLNSQEILSKDKEAYLNQKNNTKFEEQTRVEKQFTTTNETKSTQAKIAKQEEPLTIEQYEQQAQIIINSLISTEGLKKLKNALAVTKEKYKNSEKVGDNSEKTFSVGNAIHTMFKTVKVISKDISFSNLNEIDSNNYLQKLLAFLKDGSGEVNEQSFKGHLLHQLFNDSSVKLDLGRVHIALIAQLGQHLKDTNKPEVKANPLNQSMIGNRIFEL